MTGIDYSFLHLGGLYQDILDATMVGCRRFGSEKFYSVIGTARDCFAKGWTMFSTIDEIHAETGVTVSYEDICFLRKIITAEIAIEHVRQILKEACNGKG